MKKTILDIGSGTKGGKNVLWSGDNPKILHVDLQSGPGVNLSADIINLPFGDNAFETVLASHIIEHVENPLAALRELKRVAKNLVVVRVPNASFFRHRSSDPENHLYSWNQWTLKTLLKRVFQNVEVKETSRYFSYFAKNPPLKYIQIFGCMIERAFRGKRELTAVCRLAQT